VVDLYLVGSTGALSVLEEWYHPIRYETT
jgi:hypothetical protein